MKSGKLSGSGKTGRTNITENTITAMAVAANGTAAKESITTEPKLQSGGKLPVGARKRRTVAREGVGKAGTMGVGRGCQCDTKAQGPHQLVAEGASSSEESTDEMSKYLGEARVVSLGSGAWTYLTSEEAKETKIIFSTMCDCVGMVAEFRDGSTLAFHKANANSVKGVQDALEFARKKSGVPSRVLLIGSGVNAAVFPRKGKRVVVLRGLVGSNRSEKVPDTRGSERDAKIASFVYSDSSPQLCGNIHFPPGVRFRIYSECADRMEKVLLETPGALHELAKGVSGKVPDVENKVIKQFIDRIATMVSQDPEKMVASYSDRKRDITWVFDVDDIKEFQANRNEREVRLAIKKAFGKELKDEQIECIYEICSFDALVNANPVEVLVFNTNDERERLKDSIKAELIYTDEVRVERRDSDTSIENGWERSGKKVTEMIPFSQITKVPKGWRQRNRVEKSLQTVGRKL